MTDTANTVQKQEGDPGWYPTWVLIDLELFEVGEISPARISHHQEAAPEAVKKFFQDKLTLHKNGAMIYGELGNDFSADPERADPSVMKAARTLQRSDIIAVEDEDGELIEVHVHSVSIDRRADGDVAVVTIGPRGSAMNSPHAPEYTGELDEVEIPADEEVEVAGGRDIVVTGRVVLSVKEQDRDHVLAVAKTFQSPEYPFFTVSLHPELTPEFMREAGWD